MTGAGAGAGAEALLAQAGDREYDLTSRHLLVARAVEALAGPESGGRVLDIGGSKGLTGVSLPGRTVVSVDIRDAEVDAIASGTHLPFPDGSFVAAVALDVLEHVPAPLRPPLLAEAARVADIVVLAGPFDEERVRAAERRQRDRFIALFGYDHSWLVEHADCGLPSLAGTEAALAELGLATASFGSNPIELWEAQLFNTHVALRVGLDDETAAVRKELLRDFLDRADGTPPSYRHILLAARHRRPADIVGDLAPGRDEPAVLDAIDKTEQSTGRVINAGVGLIEQFKDDMANGWQSSVDQVHELERQHAELAAKYRDAHLRIEQLEALTAELREQQAAPTAPVERTLTAAESLLIGHGLPTPAALHGPPVTEPVGIPSSDLERYRGWMHHRHQRLPTTVPAAGPRFSILTPVFNPPARFLEGCLRSIRVQTYDSWELVLVDVSTAPHVQPICRRFQLLDERIRVLHLPNEGIATNTALAAAKAEGDWLVFVDHDDLIAGHALGSYAEIIESDPDVDFIYSDEDKVDEVVGRHEPFFKPDWSPDLLRTVNYIGHLVAVRRTLYEEVGGVRTGFEAAQDYDFVLRATARAKKVAHVPDVLYHWRRHETSTASDVRVKPESHAAGRRALQDFADNHVPGAWVEPGPAPTSHRLRYPLAPAEHRLSIIVPFRDGAEVTDACLQSLARFPPALPFEVLLVDNGSVKPKTAEMVERWRRQWSWVDVLADDRPFNFQGLNNRAVARAEGDLVLFLNNDTELLHHGWAEAMAEHAARPEVGAVGARLFYPNGLVQHAGVAVGIGGFAEHPWARLHPDAFPDAGPSYWVRNFLSVTAACMMVERRKFEAVAGFDERFTVCGGDVDLGIRLHEAGYWNVMTPFARVTHHESLTRDRTPPQGDIDESLRAYANYQQGRDPFYNRNLTVDDTTAQVASRQTTESTVP